MSTQPGATTSPSASSSRRPPDVTVPPTCVSLEPSTATSPVNRGAPVPSTIVPPRITRSCMWVLLGGWSAVLAVVARGQVGQDGGIELVLGRFGDPRRRCRNEGCGAQAALQQPPLADD